MESEKTSPPTRSISKAYDSTRRRRKHFLLKNAYSKAFREAGYDKIARQLADCGETELLACCSSCGGHWWVPNHCRLRVCPLCSYRVSRERARFLLAMTAHMQHPKMLTLTQPLWTDDPHVGIKQLRKNFNKLRRHVLFKSVVGGAYLIEVNVKEHGYHIHMHILLDVPFIPYQKIFSAWSQILKFKAPSIDIRSATSQQARTSLAKDASKSACRRTPPEMIVEWYEATKGERLFTTFGKWFNAKIEDLDQELPGLQTAPACPHCGDVKSTFMARDGPYVWGHDDWRDLEKVFTRDLPTQRDFVDVKKALTDPVEIIEQSQRKESTTWRCSESLQMTLQAS